MDIQAIDTFLKQSFEDSRVSRGERDVFEDMLEREIRRSDELHHVRARAFHLVQSVTDHPDGKRALDWLEKIVKLTYKMGLKDASHDSPRAWFSPGPGPRQAIIDQVCRSTRQIDICVFTITDNRITRHLIDAFRRDIKMRILTDDDKSEDRGSDIDQLADVGIPIKTDHTPNHMHHKYAIFDCERILSGSYNWTRSASERNNENLVLHSHPGLVNQFQREFDRLWREL